MANRHRSWIKPGVLFTADGVSIGMVIAANEGKPPKAMMFPLRGEGTGRWWVPIFGDLPENAVSMSESVISITGHIAGDSEFHTIYRKAGAHVEDVRKSIAIAYSMLIAMDQMEPQKKR